MGLLRPLAMAQTKRLVRELYARLPFALAVHLARGKPDRAFYIKDRYRQLVIDDYLGAFRVMINTSSDIERRMLSRSYEPDMLGAIKRFVPIGGVCVDVGANVGALTLAIAAQAGTTGIVHAIEPGKAFATRLRENLAMNPALAARVKVHEIGLSDLEGTAGWQDSACDPGTGSMLWVDPARPVTTVKVTTLDNLANEINLDRLDLLKIDVDGMDHLVVRGAKGLIQRFQPVVIFETALCDQDQISAAQEATRWFEGIGYKTYRIDHAQIRPTRFPDLSMNTLALPEGVPTHGVSGRAGATKW
jgi:FkbM family methyltransferase